MTGNTANLCSVGINSGISISNNNVTGNTANNNSQGMSIQGSGNNVIGNTANNNIDYGILEEGSNDNVTGNTANNNGDGIYFEGSNNNVTGNTANNNKQYGFWLCYSSNNNVTGNEILYNQAVGIQLDYGSAGNVLWLNVIGENLVNANVGGGSSNAWNSTVPVSYTYNGKAYTNNTGNYWGDYSAISEYHGIGYPPYTIDASNLDHYPMVSSPPMVAGFTANVTSGIAPLTVSFNDTSTGYVYSWNWSLGDGSANVTTQNASCTYYAPGSHTVVLTVEDSTGASSSTSKVITVSPATFTVNLKRGWNLVSFPVVNYTIKASSLGAFGATDVAAFNASFQSYDEYYNMSFSTSAYDFTLRPDLGYFIKCDRDSSFDVVGSAPVGRSVSLCHGWNLAGWCTYDHSTASSIVALLPNGQTVARFDASGQSFDVFAEGLSTPIYDFGMQPGEGYFINSTGPATLDYGVI